MNWLCEGKSIFTSKEIKANYIPYTYAMVTTNCDNFEIFGSPCHQLNLQPTEPMKEGSMVQEDRAEANNALCDKAFQD